MNDWKLKHFLISGTALLVVLALVAVGAYKLGSQGDRYEVLTVNVRLEDHNKKPTETVSVTIKLDKKTGHSWSLTRKALTLATHTEWVWHPIIEPAIRFWPHS